MSRGRAEDKIVREDVSKAGTAVASFLRNESYIRLVEVTGEYFCGHTECLIFSAMSRPYEKFEVVCELCNAIRIDSILTQSFVDVSYVKFEYKGSFILSSNNRGLFSNKNNFTQLFVFHLHSMNKRDTREALATIFSIFSICILKLFQTNQPSFIIKWYTNSILMRV